MYDKSDISQPGHYDPSQTAVVLLDYQNLIISMVGDKGHAVLETATKMRSWAKSQGIQVIHGVIGHNMDLVPVIKNRPRFQAILGKLAEGGADEAPQLLEGGGDVTFARKPGHISALRSPGAREFLSENGIKSLILMGISTSRVVLSTALDASDSEFVVTVVSDGCADPVDSVHETLLQNVLGAGGYVATADEFQAGYAARK